MNFIPLSISGAFEVKLEPKGDARGSFARTFCAREFGDFGLNTIWVQMNMSVSSQAGTLRGLHFQRPPYAEVKLVRAQVGRVCDVLLDMRAGSETFGNHVVVTLDADSRNAVYIPQGVAHGFQTLTDGCELQYLHSEFYTPEAEGGVQALDPDLGIDWPLPISARSDRDAALPSMSATVPIQV